MGYRVFSRCLQDLGASLVVMTGVITLLVLLAPLPAHAEFGDVILNNRAEKAGMRPVIFPHWLHRIRYNCTVCHTGGGFKMRSGADDILMADINNGKFCGMCHNNHIAWGPEKCVMCHSGLPGLKSGTRGGDSTDGPGKW
jgi:c(7)-type cytochrome triheme protein